MRDRPDNRRQRDLDAADPHVERRPVRPRELGLVDAQLDHGELGRGEREQDAEGEEAREELRRRAREERRRDRRSPTRPRRRDDRVAARRASGGEPAEAARQLAVLAERIGEPREAGDRRRHGGEQDQRAASGRRRSGATRRAAGQIAAPIRSRRRRAARGASACRARSRAPGTPRARRPRSRRRWSRRSRSPTKSERGRSTPGRRASSARFATVSSPVKASIASGSAKASSCQVGCVPSDVPGVSACGEKTKHEPEHDEQELRQEVERGHEDPERRTATGGGRGGRAATSAITHNGDDHVPRVAVERVHLQRAREVVRQEERRERDHDQVVEEERPAGHEAGEVVRARGGRTSRRRPSRGARPSPRHRRARRSGRARPTTSSTSGVKPSACARSRRARSRSTRRSRRRRPRRARARRARGAGLGACAPLGDSPPEHQSRPPPARDEERAERRPRRRRRARA